MLLTKLTTTFAVSYMSAVVHLSSYQSGSQSFRDSDSTSWQTLIHCSVVLKLVYFLSMFSSLFSIICPSLLSLCLSDFFPCCPYTGPISVAVAWNGCSWLHCGRLPAMIFIQGAGVSRNPLYVPGTQPPHSESVR